MFDIEMVNVARSNYKAQCNEIDSLMKGGSKLKEACDQVGVTPGQYKYRKMKIHVPYQCEECDRVKLTKPVVELPSLVLNTETDEFSTLIKESNDLVSK